MKVLKLEESLFFFIHKWMRDDDVLWKCETLNDLCFTEDELWSIFITHSSTRHQWWVQGLKLNSGFKKLNWKVFIYDSKKIHLYFHFEKQSVQTFLEFFFTTALFFCGTKQTPTKQTEPCVAFREQNIYQDKWQLFTWRSVSVSLFVSCVEAFKHYVQANCCSLAVRLLNTGQHW